MAVPPPRTRAREFITPSVETKAWEADLAEVSAREMWKFCMKETLTLPYGAPPRSRTRTEKFCDRVAAKGQPAVPPPMTM